jgi:glycosyltransferase involved in cell wall biosynthesis
VAAPLRVAVVARAVMPLHGDGGLERSVHDLVRHLAARGVDVTLITPPGGVQRRSPVDPFAPPRINVRHVSYLTFPFANRRGTTVIDRSTAYPLYGLRAGRLALSLVREQAIDIVHGFGASVLGYAVGGGEAPLVLNPQGMEEFGATAASWPLLKRIGYAPLRAAVRRCARHAACIIATDRSLEPAVARHLRPRPGQVRTIPNGIDLVAVSAMAGPADGLLIRQRHGVAAGEIVLLSVGRIEWNKGFDVLAAALGRAARPGGAMAAAGWRWVIVGAGPFKPALAALIASHGIAAHVHFAGRVSEAELHAWYEAATLFVHPTRYEGSSLVTLEAMAHRKAIVATMAGGLPDKVTPGENGWLVAPGDASGLAAAIEAATAEPAQLAAMGRRSRDRVEHDFAWSSLAGRYLELYEELRSRRAAHTR